MEPECRRISREVVPAVRAYLAEVMSIEYGYRQQQIAKKLGIAQVAVSKYLNGKYSEDVARMKRMVSQAMTRETARTIIESKDVNQANAAIEKVSEQYVLIR
jgi:predicted transcriptional regulator